MTAIVSTPAPTTTRHCRFMVSWKTHRRLSYCLWANAYHPKKDEDIVCAERARQENAAVDS